MTKAVRDLSTTEFEQLIAQAIDKRLAVWLTQVTDALSGFGANEGEMRTEFADSLRQAILQSANGDTVDLGQFRRQVGR